MEGVNVIKTPKPTQLNPEGGILETEAAIHVSNVQLLDPKTNEPTRVDTKLLMVKSSYCKKSGEEIKSNN